MPALTPVSEEEFIRIASEEGVPLPLAAAFYAVESRAGTNAGAFVDPREKAGKPNGPNSKWNSNPDKIGYGSMQLTRPTFEQYMPGMDFYEATDSDLTRAGMRLLKTAVREDGTFDFQKAKIKYFGAGVDKSFGDKYAPSTNSARDSELRRVIEAVSGMGDEQSPLSLQATALKAIKDPSAKQWDSGTSVAIQNAESEAKIANDKFQAAKANYQVDADFGAMESVMRQAQQKFSDVVKAAADMKADISKKILDVAESNPYGAFGEMQKTFEALKQSQGMLRAVVDAKNYRGSSATGLQGILETFVAKVGADAVYDDVVKQTQALQASAQNYQNIIGKMEENASKSLVDPQTLIQASQEARQVGLDAIRFPMEKLSLDKFNAQQAATDDRASANREIQSLRLQAQKDRDAAANTARQLSSQGRASTARNAILENNSRTAISIANLKAQGPSKISSAQIRALSNQNLAARETVLLEAIRQEKQTANDQDVIRSYEQQLKEVADAKEVVKTFGEEVDTDYMSDAANKFMAARSENKQYVPHNWTYKEIKDQILSNKELKPLFDKFLTEGFEPQVVVGTDIEVNARKLQTSNSATERAVGDLGSATIENRIISILDQEMGRRFPKKGNTPAATWQSAIDNPMQLQGKEKLKDELYKVAQKRVREELSSLPVNELNAQNNPANVIHTPQEWLQIAGTGGLADTVAAIKMDPRNLESDAKLISTILFNSMSGKLPITPPQLLDQLQDYYSAKADLRASDSSVKALNIPMDKNAYIVTTRDGKRYNLASAPELKAYIDRAFKGMMPSYNFQGRIGVNANDPVAARFSEQFFQALDSTKGN